MILGRIVGKVSTTHFQFLVTAEKTRKFQFIQIQHPEYGFVLGQVMELLRTEEELTAQCTIIGYKDEDGRVKSIRTPFALSTEVLEAEDDFIRSIVEIGREGAFIGNLEGKSIPITMDLQKVLTRHLAILAKSGAGKSYTVGVLLEEIMEKKVPVLIIDPHGEYASLKFPSEESREKLMQWNLEPKGYSFNVQEYGDMKLKQDLRPLKLDEKMSSYELMKLLPIQLSNTQEAMLFSVLKDLTEVTFDNIVIGLENLNSSAKWGLIDTMMYLRDLKLFSSNYTPLRELVAPGKCAIINLKGLTPEVQSMIVYKLLKDLFMARKQEKIPPFFCVIEEAHNFCPEKGFGKAVSTEMIRLISSEGRKFGLGLCVVSQRPALVQKTVLAQCSSQIIMKVTNPNDLKAITGSLEGITPETEDEIQNLPVGSALVCGVVDRPLVVNIRPRRSMHGGQAVDILGSVVEMPDEEDYQKNIVEETKEYEDKGLLYVVKPKLSLKDIQLMSTQPIRKVTTYLIPAVFFSCRFSGMDMNFLVDQIKGKVVIDPDSDQKCEMSQLSLDSAFLRKPVFENIEYDQMLERWIETSDLKRKLEEHCQVDDYKECYIVFRKIEY
ncbi:ATPase [Candidatus Woesearchaeota archaeon CG10_big_fil_rev_8_21_14_0_10_45_16]|nr:MAG: ATPase [Candidatus Woesearchaeota archaeon CG10_big_fil_rev_8_21_14_0_10_45_16]